VCLAEIPGDRVEPLGRAGDEDEIGVLPREGVCECGADS
jgi:hypothetical protein